ncbi:MULTISPECIES: sugar ABC transporter ATP-binding protein [Alphaproteobacteria]|uniref:Sugar ABC transporter ATP-binding protein n=2 Tax=Alphaproteobacteria TaxID=28211 RepID=A0A512HNL5_9HYPH|nr:MULTISPECIES: sugar ABC transporter ATP-binding protein [Alphaproteobacteria]GEO87033.1 sugar ABC transporter ATP-binding protein [Ciceribacter naphthalenivorans]GLR21591.1 sugar ABC transporter ATP-binding protein [Ciceribacter naphthalenivorans]GLT04447.1 sugar ABC transporter ATP-binding protein [Sphingomonas psychrolutea]
MSTFTPPLVQMTGICKTFPGVRALDGVDFTLLSGEVHVLFGENGAGKSTLISILSGVYPQTEGTLAIKGKTVTFSSVHDAKDHGVAAVFQEFSLVPTLSVAENIFLGSEPMWGPFVDRKAMVRAARDLFAGLDFQIDVRAKVVSLSRAEQQMVEIAKAIHSDAKILILDEPTASLTERETEALFRIIREAKAQGVGIVYISHRIQEFSTVADRITVLRDGKLIGTVGVNDLSHAGLVEMMTGRAIDEIYPQIASIPDGDVVLSIRGLKAWGVNGVDIDIRAGEVLGIAGLVGSGKSRAWRAALGIIPMQAGSVLLKGRDVSGQPTRRFVRDGVFYLPPDRKSEGLMLGATTRQNINLGLLDREDVSGAMGGLSPRRLRDLSDGIGRKVDLADAYMDRTISNLSGGNQQKALFGRGFGQDYDLYIFDEPTVGVDMGTRAALYRLIKDIAEAGKAVVVISSDLPEVMNLAHRLIVFSAGTISAELSGEGIDEQIILKSFFSHERQTA